MKKTRDQKGFTLIEMLVVIAIIAVLVAIIIPTVMSSTDKAAAAADAANLRSVLGQLNAVLMSGEQEIDEAAAIVEAPESKLHPGAKLYVLYTVPGVIDVFFVQGDAYYGLDYLSAVAQSSETLPGTAKPATAAGDTWYIVGQGSVE